MKALFVAALLVAHLGFINQSKACINSYTFEFGNKLSKEELKKHLVKSRVLKDKSLEHLNDYGVLLIYDKQYVQAIEIFKNIEKQHPNLAKTAANLGTAYELNQQPEQAKYWIEQGIKRDPHIHEGSEWIHVKILDAQLAQQKDHKWIQQHDVLGLDFGTQAAPKSKVQQVKFNGHSYALDTVLEHSKIQMKQRLQFVNHDPITAQILFNMANIEVVQYLGEDDSTVSLYDMAKRFGDHRPELIEARLDYLKHSKWYKFKSVIATITMHLKRAFMSLIVEIKHKL